MILEDATGRKVVDVVVPPACDSQVEHTPSARVIAEPLDGWDFSGNVPMFDGTTVPVSGRPKKVLRVLAEAHGPVTIDQLRAAAWDGYDATDSAIRYQIVELRTKLQKHFPTWEGEVIETTGNGYALLIV